MPTKLTFFPLGEGKVRQLALKANPYARQLEVSNDEGKTWTVTYDLIYTRRK